MCGWCGSNAEQIRRQNVDLTLFFLDFGLGCLLIRCGCAMI
jgi:hypothetical protein